MRIVSRQRRRSLPNSIYDAVIFCSQPDFVRLSMIKEREDVYLYA